MNDNRREFIKKSLSYRYNPLEYIRDVNDN